MDVPLMWRALLLLTVLAAPAAAQVGTSVNPYNPYVNLASRGALRFRTYSSLDRLNVEHQYRAAPTAFGALSTADSALATSAPPAAAFRFYPNYPLLNAPASGFRSPAYASLSAKQPLPFTAPLPIETACDPYFDDDGCLGEFADW